MIGDVNELAGELNGIGPETPGVRMVFGVATSATHATVGTSTVAVPVTAMVGVTFTAGNCLVILESEGNRLVIGRTT